MKSLFIYQNKKTPKTHDLIEIYKMISEMIDLKDKLFLLDQISKYHIEESYPAFNRSLPSREEIEEVLFFTKTLFEEICNILTIDPSEVQC